MPIRPEHRHHYRTPEWRAVCEVVDARAGGRCERCGCPNGMEIFRVYGTVGPWPGPRFMYWKLRSYTGPWIDMFGRELIAAPPVLWNENRRAETNCLTVVLTHAHLNQDPSDYREENVALLCQWCHNMHDAPVRAQHARVTRCKRKDARRPLIETYRDNEGDVVIERSAPA